MSAVESLETLPIKTWMIQKIRPVTGGIKDNTWPIPNFDAALSDISKSRYFSLREFFWFVAISPGPTFLECLCNICPPNLPSDQQRCSSNWSIYLLICNSILHSTAVPEESMWKPRFMTSSRILRPKGSCFSISESFSKSKGHGSILSDKHITSLERRSHRRSDIEGTKDTNELCRVKKRWNKWKLQRGKAIRVCLLVAANEWRLRSLIFGKGEGALNEALEVTNISARNGKNNSKVSTFLSSFLGGKDDVAFRTSQ